MRYSVFDISDASFDTLYKNLSEEEKQRTDKIKGEGDKLRHVCAVALLSMLFNESREGDVSYEKLEVMEIPKTTKSIYGKPRFIEGPHFSYSHSENLVLCAVSGSPVGADIEIVKEVNENLKDRFFLTKEKALPFFEVWTKKEASAKKTGIGLSTLIDIDSTVFEYLTFEKYDKKGRKYIASIDY